MSWTDFYRRRDAIDQVLAWAEQHRGAGLPYEVLPEVTEVFDDRAELALALQYKWSQVLQGRVSAALNDAERTPDIDHVDAVAAAYRTAAATRPVLRELLEAHAGHCDATFREALRAEQRMLAYAAGLAEPDEPADETARIGAAFTALVRSGPGATARRRNPIEQLFRRLVASA